MALDLLDGLNATAPLLVKVSLRLLGQKCPSKTHLPLCLQKHLGDSSYGSRLSSESDLVSSEQSEDGGGSSDDSRSTVPEEWHGFQNTTSDSANHDGEPGSSSDSRLVLAIFSSGMSRPFFGYIFLTQST